MPSSRSHRNGAAKRAAAAPQRGAADRAANSLRESILSGELPAGQDLPGERELAARLGVSRLTLRAALTRLSAEGLVRSVQGSGNRVLDFREHGGVDLLAYLARSSLGGGELPRALLLDLLELRRVVAVEVLGLVAERASDEELSGLRAHLHHLGEVVDDAERFMEADLFFARLVVRASHNLALELLFNTIVRVVIEQPGLELMFVANASQTLSVYGRLLDLVERREADRVRRVARRLMDRLDGATMARVEQLAGVLSKETGR